MVVKPENIEGKAKKLRVGDETAIENMLEEEIDRRLFSDRVNVSDYGCGTIFFGNPHKVLSRRYCAEHLGDFPFGNVELWNFFKRRLLRKYEDAGWVVTYDPARSEWVPSVGNNVYINASFDFSRRKTK